MSRRLTRVNELIRRELGDILQRDFTFQDALVTIHEVDITPDLRQCHVYLGIIGNQLEKKHVMESLIEKRVHLQKRLSSRVTLKYTPQLHFKTDDSIERGVKIISLMDEMDLSDPDE